MAEKSVTPEQIMRAAAGVALPGEAAKKPSLGDLAVEDALARQTVAKANKALENKLKEDK